MNCFYNLGKHISEEKKIVKIIANLPYQLHAKVIVIKYMYKPTELTINELVGYLQVFKIHNLLTKQDLKTIKGSSFSIEMNSTLVSDDISDSNEEEMELLSKRFTRFFMKMKPYFWFDGKESPSTKGSKSISMKTEIMKLRNLTKSI